MFILAEAVLVLLGIILILIPPEYGASLFGFFTLEDFGIRKIRRWNNTTDTIGNLLIWVSLALCIVYFLIPYYEVVYAVWLAFTLCCVLSRAYLVVQKESRWQQIVIIAVYFITAAIGFLCVLGAFNDSISIYPVQQLSHDFYSHYAFDLWYILTDIYIPYTILQGLIMFLPLFYLWEQFKYMRLEGKIQARHIITFILFAICFWAFMIALSQYGFLVINEAYQVQWKN